VEEQLQWLEQMLLLLLLQGSIIRCFRSSQASQPLLLLLLLLHACRLSCQIHSLAAIVVSSKALKPVG
jgi:hypothetical protein